MAQADKLQPKAYEGGYNISFSVSGGSESGEDSEADYGVLLNAPTATTAGRSPRHKLFRARRVSLLNIVERSITSEALVEELEKVCAANGGLPIDIERSCPVSSGGYFGLWSVRGGRISAQISRARERFKQRTISALALPSAGAS